jgi:hypothetical protein
MASYDLTMSDTRFVFPPDYNCISFYSINLGEITQSEQLIDTNPKFVKLKLSGSTLQVTNGLSEPASGTYSSYEEFGPSNSLSDVWNSSTELIVGTGDLQPDVLNTDKYLLTNKGIVITSPAADTIGIYILS